MAVPNIFGSATSAIPLSQLDQNFATAITLGNTAVYLGNTTTSLGNVTLTNVTISSGNVSVSTATVGAGSNTAPSITTTGDTNTGIFFPAADTIAFSEGGVEAMRLDSAGNLGLGVTPTGISKFEVYTGNTVLNGVTSRFNGSNSPIALASTTSNGFPYLGFNTVQIVSSDNQTYAVNGFASRISHNQGGTGGFQFNVAASGTAGNTISFTQAMTLDASGNLGIGMTPSSTVRFDVSGPAASWGIRTRGGGNAGIPIASFADVNGAGEVRIDSSGNLLVGKTSSSATVGDGFGFGPDGQGHAASTYSTNAATVWSVYSTSAAAYRFYVGYGGTIFATSIVITAISDQRLKENVRDIDTGLSSIMALKPRRFDWKEGKGQDKKNVAGFIAQEFEDVFPECVATSLAGADGIEYKNINHETLIPTLVKAIQEQQALIVSMREEIEALKIKVGA
jgi:hypothetical protein